MRPQIFLSYAGKNAFEANLLQSVLENLFSDLSLVVWSYKRDQLGNERDIASSLKTRVKESSAVIFLISPFTLENGANQWVELGYADAYDIPTFVLLHHMTFEELKKHERNVPPLLLAGECTLAVDWRKLEDELRQCCSNERS